MNGVAFGYTPIGTDEARESGIPFPTVEVDLSTVDDIGFATVLDIATPPRRRGRPAKPKKERVVSAEWERRLVVGNNGELKSSVENVHTILTSHEAWAGKIRKNLRRGCTVFSAGTPICNTAEKSLTDVDYGYVVRWLSQEYKIDMSPTSPNLTTTIEMIANENAFDPVKDYLAALAWDGVERIDGLLTEYFKAVPASEMHAVWLRAVGSKFLISAVARTFEPGCKADQVLVLSGTTGFFKSTGVMMLALGKYHDTLQEFDSKDAMMKLNEVWLVELEEMQAYRKSDVEACKSFVSRCVDKYRSPYGRNVENHPRRCVFMGTTEHHDFLNDDTNRRFWPVEIVAKANLEKLAADRDQLWAEAVHRYRAGEPWHITDDALNAESLRVQNAHARQDAWLDVVREYLSSRPLGAYETTVSEVLTNAVKIEVGRWTQTDQTRVARILKKLGYVKFGRTAADEQGKRLPTYRRERAS
jgi:putative DNA primase/helicase